MQPLFTEFSPVSYDEWLAQAGGEGKSKVLWGPWDDPGSNTANSQPWPAAPWEILDSVPPGLFALAESDAPAVQLRSALRSGAAKFLVPVDTIYFQEIAKFRALRRLFDHPIYVAALTGASHQTVYDPHVNLLRSTSCAMAAVLGGCDALVVRPFDAVRNEASELGQRLARNTQLLLREESGFAELRDPAAGSWYIESLTQQLVEAARSDSPVPAPNWRRRVLVGTTRYADPLEQAGLDGVSDGRIATPWERLRLAVEKSGRRPMIRLAMGRDRKMSRARADFARNVFASAGFSIGEPADYVVLCGADPEYPEMVDKLRAETAVPLIVAGPETAGAMDFVNMKSDIPAKLRDWLLRIGIEEQS